MKKSIKSSAFVHGEHIDISLDLDKIPFNVNIDDILFCQVKGYQRKGLRLDGKLHLFVLKKENISQKDIICACDEEWVLNLKRLLSSIDGIEDGKTKISALKKVATETQLEIMEFKKNYKNIQGVLVKKHESQ